MADQKISALTPATTPLAGTEVLPIVQSGSTVKVANNDLRPKQIQSNATSGVLQVAGPAAGTTRVMTTPDANFTAARTDTAQTFTGLQTFNNGVSFGSSTLSNYTAATTWTPTDDSGAGLTFTNTSGNCLYTRIGNIIFATFMVTFPVTADITGAKIGGLPTAARSTSNDISPVSISFCDATFSVTGRVGSGTTFMTFYNSSGVLLTNANFSGKTIRAMAIYMV
jgi:hypothetical protein